MTNFNRDQLIEDYSERIVNNMSAMKILSFVLAMVKDDIRDCLENYTDEELVDTVKKTYPDMIDQPIDSVEEI